MDFLTEVRKKYLKGTVHLVLDNLRLHHSHAVRDLAEDLNIKLHFMPVYSSEYNPIEWLWGYSKRYFTGHCLAEASFT